MMTRGDVMGAASPVVPPLSVLLLPVPASLLPTDTESPENTKSQCTCLHARQTITPDLKFEFEWEFCVHLAGHSVTVCTVEPRRTPPGPGLLIKCLLCSQVGQCSADRSVMGPGHCDFTMYIYQITILSTVNSHNVVCLLHLNKAGKMLKTYESQKSHLSPTLSYYLSSAV